MLIVGAFPRLPDPQILRKTQILKNEGDYPLKGPTNVVVGGGWWDRQPPFSRPPSLDSSLFFSWFR